MNAFEIEKHNVSEKEFAALQTNFQNGFPRTFSNREKIALEYARLISAAPLSFPADFINQLKREFSEREIVMLATTAAQVNYWARIAQSLGIPPAGFTDKCENRNRK
jgi:alkylhydroperoxidase family enzyme